MFIYISAEIVVGNSTELAAKPSISFNQDGKEIASGIRSIADPQNCAKYMLKANGRLILMYSLICDIRYPAHSSLERSEATCQVKRLIIAAVLQQRSHWGWVLCVHGKSCASLVWLNWHSHWQRGIFHLPSTMRIADGEICVTNKEIIRGIYAIY